MSASASAARLRARRVSQELFAAAALHLLRIFSVLATERQATVTRGWGRPKFHTQALTSYTWLPLRNTISKLGTTYSTYEILAWLRLLDLWLTAIIDLQTSSSCCHQSYLWFTYNLLILFMIYLCKSCSLISLMFYLCFTHVLLMIYSWFFYDLHILLMTYLFKSCFLRQHMIYLWFTY